MSAKDKAKLIIQTIARESGLSVAEMLAPCREWRRAEARFFAMALCREHAPFTWAELSKLFLRKRDTVRYGVSRLGELVEVDFDVCARFEAARLAVTQALVAQELA